MSNDVEKKTETKQVTKQDEQQEATQVKKKETKPPVAIPSILERGIKIASISIGLVILFIFAVWLLPQPYYKTGFRNLTELKAYAQTIDEWIKMENDNVLFPSYENYYKRTFTRTFWSKWREKFNGLLSRLWLKHEPLFSASFFKTVLEDVTAYRVQKGWQGDFIQKFEVKPTSKIVVFGVVQGVFHSLVRYLEQLKKLGIIDENLKLTSNDYYMVFLGNVVNRSPYTLEIFATILRLLQQNPNHVIYLRGTNEFYAYWKDHTLCRELELRCDYLSLSKIPLVQEVNKFFNTLPITMYATMPAWSSNQEFNFFKLHAYIGDKRLLNLLNEDHYAIFLLNGTEGPTAFNLLKQDKAKQHESNKLTMRAIVHDIMKRDDYEVTHGLSLLPPEKGIITWAVLSCPSESYQKLYNFSYETFSLITPAQIKKNWLIQSYFRNVKSNNLSFERQQRLFFVGT